MHGTLTETPHSSATSSRGTDAAGRATRAIGPIIPPGVVEILPPRVLVVDDEGLLRWSLAEMLHAAGYAVLQARDGREARLAFADPIGPPDAILLDLKLPDAHGLELLQEARVECPACPVVIMTAYGTADVVEAALVAGAVRVMAKPFDLDVMVALVRELCPLPWH